MAVVNGKTLLKREEKNTLENDDDETNNDAHWRTPFVTLPQPHASSCLKEGSPIWSSTHLEMR